MSDAANFKLVQRLADKKILRLFIEHTPVELRNSINSRTLVMYHGNGKYSVGISTSGLIFDGYEESHTTCYINCPIIVDAKSKKVKLLPKVTFSFSDFRKAPYESKITKTFSGATFADAVEKGWRMSKLTNAEPESYGEDNYSIDESEIKQIVQEEVNKVLKASK